MEHFISDDTIETIEILAKLSLSKQEKEQAKKDIGVMLDYFDKLKEPDTNLVEPMTHVFPLENVFREDEVTNTDQKRQTLANAPKQQDGCFLVPKTIV